MRRKKGKNERLKENKQDFGKRVERVVNSELGERWRVTESEVGGGSCVVNGDSVRYSES